MSINLRDYTLLVGENNSGKTCVLTALRTFYEEGGVKFSNDMDFPKFQTDDAESWIEIEYLLNNDEQDTLKEDYRSINNVLKVRRYFKSDNKDLVKSNQSNIYAYENGILSKTLFYGAKNISQAKLGSVIYIPEVNKVDDSLKLSGPSPFREMVNFVMKRAVAESSTFSALQGAFDKFNEKFKEEASEDGFSVKALVSEINNNIANWKIRFGVDINPIRPEDMVKNLLSHYIEDGNLNDKRVNINSFGQGLQRHLIYTLIRLSAKFVEPRQEKKKDFSPDYTLILFEEPEAFLHPSQQEKLNAGLRSLSTELGQQVLITTHSPQFVSKQIIDLPSIVRLSKPTSMSKTYQLSPMNIDNILDGNIGLYKLFCNMLNDPNVDDELKRKIRNTGLGEDNRDEDKKLEEEAMRYLLWLNAERSAMFFAKHVVVCEGPSEKVLFEYMIDQKWSDLRDLHVYFVDALGKYNIHRYIALLSGLGIPHSVLMDSDNARDVHGIVNKFISDRRTEFTTKFSQFDKDLEEFLGIERTKRTDLKPLNVISKVRSGEITEEKMTELRKRIDSILEN